MKNQKINSIDIAKTLSDFLFLGVENPEEKARKIFEIKHSLTAHGFEKYLQYYFEKYKGYKVKLNGGTYECDGGIDLKGIKYQNGENLFLIAQCKKYSTKDISEDDIAHFYGKIVNKIINKKDKTEIFYITTSKFTHKAKIFGIEQGIKTIDFFDIYKMQELYNLDIFKKDLINQEGLNEYEKSFIKGQKILELYDNYYNITQPTNIELYHFLKQVRRDYAYKNQIRLGDIAKNDTLELLARKRPHNFDSLKITIQNLSTREKNKILKHGHIFIQRLSYFYNSINDTDNKSEEKKTFLRNIIEIFKI